MNNYELMVIFNPYLSDAEVTNMVAAVKKTVSDEKGEVLAEDLLGRRKFFHTMAKKRDGFYAYFKIRTAPKTVSKIKRDLKLKQNVFRVEILRAAREILKK